MNNVLKYLVGGAVAAVGSIGAIDWADVAAHPMKLVYIGGMIVGGAVVGAAREALKGNKDTTDKR